MNDVTVVIPVYGNLEVWGWLAARAERSAHAQTVAPKEVVVSVAETLWEARNVPALAATTEWLCFLDADDELDPTYVEAMLAGRGDVRQPSTLGIVGDDVDDFPVLIPAKPLLDGNFIVVGAFVRTELFQAVGGFKDFDAFEDWDLWIRCWLAGGEIGACPEAVYRVHVRPASRNHLSPEYAGRLFNAIRRQYLGRTPAIPVGRI